MRICPLKLYGGGWGGVGWDVNSRSIELDFQCWCCGADGIWGWHDTVLRTVVRRGFNFSKVRCVAAHLLLICLYYMHSFWQYRRRNKTRRYHMHCLSCRCEFTPIATSPQFSWFRYRFHVLCCYMLFCHFACGNCVKLPTWLKMIRRGVGAALPAPKNPKAQYPRVTKNFRLVIFWPVAHESDLFFIPEHKKTGFPLYGGKTMGRSHDFLTSSEPFTQWYSTVPPSENHMGSPMNLKGSRVEKNASRVEVLNFLKTDVCRYFYMFISIFT